LPLTGPIVTLSERYALTLVCQLTLFVKRTPCDGANLDLLASPAVQIIMSRRFGRRIEPPWAF
jgi:hypothetical protein